MSVAKFHELGADREAYRAWREEQAAKRRLLPKARESVRVERVVEVVERVKEALDQPYKPSAEFRAMMKPGETYDDTRNRLSQDGATFQKSST